MISQLFISEFSIIDNCHARTIGISFSYVQPRVGSHRRFSLQVESRVIPQIDWNSGRIETAAVRRSVRCLRDLRPIFHDVVALGVMDPETVVYRVELWAPVAPDTEGGLFWGVTTIEPGRVGDEYFMTQGHFHSIRNRAEFYCTASGQGALLLMDEQRKMRVEMMSPGSLHYIPAHTAHRAVNTGDTPLCFWACWPSDAGHDYSSILDQGFSARVLLRSGAPTLVPEVELAGSER